ncbi:MAG: sortase domain-bontaining protein [Anaerolineales bacterium]
MMEYKKNWKVWLGKGILSVLIAFCALIGLLSVFRQTAQAGAVRSVVNEERNIGTASQLAQSPQSILPDSNANFLTITKKHNPHFLVNGVGVYTITITNTSSSSDYVLPIIITDSLPSNLHYKEYGGIHWTCDARVVCTNTTGITATGKSNITISVTSTFTNSQFVTNTVIISGTTLTAKDKTDVSADLEVAKTMRPLSSAGHLDLIFIITATNKGPNDVANVVLTDTIPSTVTVKTSSTGYNKITGRWEAGSIPANQSKVLTITATINKCGGFTNTISGISSNLTDTIKSNNIASKTVKNICAQLDLNKTDNNTYIIPGQTITYYIPITNVGFITATNLIITDPIDSQFSFITYSIRKQDNSLIPFTNISFTKPSSAGGIYKWILNNFFLNPNQRITMTLRTKVADSLSSGEGGTNFLANTAFIKYLEDYNNYRVKSDSDSSYTPNLTIVQNSVSPTEGKVNDRLTFSFVIKNHNPSVQATNVVFTDTFPSYLTYYSSSPYGSYNSATRVFSIDLGTINASNSKTVTIYMTINNAASSTQTLNNIGTLHFYHGPYYQYRQSNTVQYRILGTSTLPGTGFPPIEASFSYPPVAFWLVLLISIFILFLGLGGIGFGILRRQSAWAGWSRQMGVFITLIGGLFLIFAFLLIQKGQPIEQTVTLNSPSPILLPTSTAYEFVPAFQDLATLPDYPIPTPTNIPAEVNGNAPDDSPPNRILIPSLNLDTVVKYVPFDGFTWLISGLQNEIAWMGSTSWPGLGGNTGLAGHVTLRNGADGPFRHLEDLQINDVITVFTERNSYTYKVSQKKVVKDDDFSIVQPSQQPILTLITCTGWNQDLGHYLQRLVVVADLVEMKPIAAQSMITR